MSRGDENLDKMFQDAFSGQEHPIDPLFWEGMKPMLQAPKVAWYMTKTFIAISTVAILSTSIYLISDSTPENQIQADLASSKTILLNSETHSKTTNNELNTAKNSTDYKINKSYNQESTITNKGHETANSKISDDASSTKKSLGSATTVTSKPKETKNTSNSNNPISSTVSANSQVNNTEQNIASNETYSSNNPKIDHTVKPSQKANQKEELATKTVISASSVSMMATTNNIATNKNEVKNTASNETAVSNEEVLHPKSQNDVGTSNHISSWENDYTNAIAQNGNTILVGLMATNSDYVFPYNDEISPPTPSKSDGSLKPLNKPFSVRLSAGYLWSKSLTDPQNNIRNYANNKNIELNLEYHFKPRWGIQIGASFNQLTEDQCHSYPNVEDNSYYDYTDREITLNDSTWWLGGWFYYPPYQDTVTDTAYISRFDTGQVDLKTSQQIKVIEIPVLLTYNFSVQQFTAQIATGASIGVFANTSGNYLEYGDPVTVKPSSRNLFNSLQYNYLLRTELGYSLNDHWQIAASPQMKINLNSLYKNESGFTNKYLFYGINAGLTYHF